MEGRKPIPEPTISDDELDRRDKAIQEEIDRESEYVRRRVRSESPEFPYSDAELRRMILGRMTITTAAGLMRDGEK